MINHQAAVLNDFDICFCKSLGNRIVPDARLQPHGFRFLCEYVVQVSWNIPGTAKDVYQVDLDGYVDQLAIDLLPKDLGHLRVIDRHGNDFEARGLKIAGNIERGLARLRLSFDSKHRDGELGGE